MKMYLGLPENHTPLKEDFSMTTEQNKALIQQRVESMNRHNLEATLAVFHPNYQDHNGPPPGYPSGIEGDRLFFSMLLNAFPDLEVTTEDLIAEGDRVVERLTLRGTHKGMFMGASPTGKRVMWGFINIYRIADGKVVELWSEGDRLGLMQQIGLVPPPQPAG
jgi:predicted ester cyclase